MISCKKIIWSSVVFLFPCGGRATLQAQDTGATRSRSVYEDLQMFSQVLNQIRVNHPDSIDPHDLFMAAIEGMVRAADPHSYVIPAIRLSPDREEAMREGRLQPVPVQFTYIDDAPIVASVSPGSAASTQDILPGDQLLAIDGDPVLANSAPELDLVLAGEKGTTVTMTLERRRWDGSIVRVARTVAREEPTEQTAIVASLMLDEQTGYVRISHFATDDVADDFHDALGDLKDQGMKQLVLDLRDNAGGLVEEAAKVTGEFLPRGSVVYTAEGRKEEVWDTVTVGRSFWRREERYPVVVMVNGGTASAAELVAGALQDHDRALIVGRATFGKSLIMQTFPLTDGSLIVLVVGQIRTPCGRIIQRDYRGVSQRDYVRRAGTFRDTTRLPSCRTASGRTVYGGGGIYPDVILSPPAPEPLWYSELLEKELVLRWVGGFLGDSSSAVITSVSGSETLPPDVVSDFVMFASSEGVEVPADARNMEVLAGLIVGHIAWARGGEAEYYARLGRRSRAVAAATAELERAAALLTW